MHKTGYSGARSPVGWEDKMLIKTGYEESTTQSDRYSIDDGKEEILCIFVKLYRLLNAG